MQELGSGIYRHFIKLMLSGIDWPQSSGMRMGCMDLWAVQERLFNEDLA